MHRTQIARVLGSAVALALIAAGGVGAVPASAATASCSAFVAKIYDQVNPSTQVQSLTARGDQAVTANATGYTTVRPVTMTAAVGSGSQLAGVRRLYKASTKDYFYANTATEIARVKKSGYVDQGVVFYAATKAAGCLQRVYSFVRSSKHRYVTTAAERTQLKRDGWSEEKNTFYVGKVASVITFAIYPDTQNEVYRDNDPKFSGRSQWLVAMKPLLGLRYAMHTGDIVSWDTPDHAQYVRARRALSVLDGQLAYSAAAGNHDTAAVGVGGSAADPPNTARLVRDTTSYNQYLRPGMHRTTEFQPGHAENSYALFSAGGLNWMTLTLELWPRREVVAWAREVVASHPKHNVIVVTHSYLSANGTLSTSNGGYGATSPQYLYDNLIKRYPNIKMTFSGHTGTAAYRRDVGVKGNDIHNYLLAMHSNTTNPTRLVEINVNAGVVSSWVYAPLTKTSYPSYYRAPAAVSWVR